MKSSGGPASIPCRRFIAGLNDYLDDALDTAVRTLFDRHTAECRRCRIVSETTRKTLELYRMFPPPGIPPALESRLLAAIQAGRVKL